MVIVRVLGGLGNQLFHYAAGKRLSLVRGVELKLDATPLERSGVRAYQLSAFNIQSQFATRHEIRDLKYGRVGWKNIISKKGSEGNP